MASASSAARSSRRSVALMRSGATRTSRLKLRANALRAIAWPSAERVAVIQTPRPGSRRFRSGTAVPSGVTTNRIMSSTGRTVPVDAHSRSVPRAVLRGPASSASSIGCASIIGPNISSPLRRCGFRRRLFGRRRCEVLFLDPAGLDAGLHDQRLGFVARQLEAVEDAGVLGGLTVFAFAPADKIVGGATREVLDRLDVVLAELDEHRGSDTRNLAHRILYAQFLALGVELCFLRGEVLARAVLELAGSLFVEAFDAGDFFLVDHRQLFHRLEAF